MDRLIQQAIHQALEPIFDTDFSPHSYGFRRGRSTHDAVKKAREYVEEGRRWVVDIDLEKLFDRVSHDVLMARIAAKTPKPILDTVEAPKASLSCSHATWPR